MALTLSGTNGVVGAGFTLDPSGTSVTAGVGTFGSVKSSGAVNASAVGVSTHIEITNNTGITYNSSGGLSAFYKDFSDGTTMSGYVAAIKTGSAGSRANAMTFSYNKNVTVTSGNLIIGTAGKGIDFSAQTPTAVSGASNTAEVLDHYEEGTWTPTNASGQSVDTIANNGAWTISGGAKYTRIGDMVTVYIAHWQVPSTGGNYGFAIGGLPFTNMASISVGTNTIVSNSTNAEKGLVVAGTNKIYLYPANTLTQTTNAGLSTKTLYGISATYKVS